MKRSVLDAEYSALDTTKRARLVPDDADSAYVSLGSSTPVLSVSPKLPALKNQEGSVASPVGTKRAKIYACPYNGCDKSFDRPARLEIHLRSHTKERPYICDHEDCDKSFLRSEHLKAHIKSKHADSRNYICSYQLEVDAVGQPVLCGKSFHTGTRLRRHIAAHEDKEQTKCQECGQIFRKQETLQRHIRSEHLHEDAYRCTNSAHGDGDNADMCGQTFPTVGQLKAHEAREHSGLRYFCDACHIDQDSMAERASFATYSELQQHIKEVHPPTCGICGYIASSNRALKAHTDIVHQSLSDRKRFACTYEGCDRKFTKRGNLNVHMETVHANIKAYKCGDFDLSNSKNVEGWSGLGCGISFGTKASLEGHVRTQHLDLPQTINAKTERKSASIQPRPTPAINATASITGFGYDESRPIACLEDECGSRFHREHDLVIHLELHHGWNIDDINDVLAEAAALKGDQFWIGGLDPTDVHPTDAGEILHPVEALSLLPHEPMDTDQVL